MIEIAQWHSKMKHSVRSVFGKWAFSIVQCCNTSWHCSSISCRLFVMVFLCIFDFRMTERPLWHGAPSCMKIRSLVPEKPRLLAHLFSWGISRFCSIVLYCSWFICPSTMCKRPVPNTLMTLHTMTFVGCFTHSCFMLFLSLYGFYIKKNRLNTGEKPRKPSLSTNF